MATSRRVGNYSTSAKAVVRASDQIFDAAMSGKPDFTKISKEAIKGRSMERRAVTKAEGEVASAGLEAFNKTKYAKTRAETAEKVESIKNPARRFAGVVGALGTLSGAYVLGQSSKKDKAAHDEWMKKFDERTKAIDARLSQPNPTPEMIPDAPTLERPTLSTDQPSPGSGSNSNSGSGGATFEPSETSMSYMQKLTSQGLSPVQAAATVGHLVVETGNFRHLEELEPNRHGTKGYGHLQWTDTKPGKGRRTDFTNWSSTQGLNPSSLSIS